MGDQKKPGDPSRASRDRMTRGDVRVSGVLAILLLLTLSGAAAGWGPEGHVIVTRAALAAAGVLAHFAGDAAVPLHATRHHHGWVGPNPEGFTRAGEIHQWFESALVARIDPAEVRAGPEAARALHDVPGAVRAVLDDSLAQVPRLYRLERESRDTHDDAPARALARARLAAGATLLAPPRRPARVT